MAPLRASNSSVQDKGWGHMVWSPAVLGLGGFTSCRGTSAVRNLSLLHSELLLKGKQRPKARPHWVCTVHTGCAPSSYWRGGASWGGAAARAPGCRRCWGLVPSFGRFTFWGHLGLFLALPLPTKVVRHPRTPMSWVPFSVFVLKVKIKTGNKTCFLQSVFEARELSTVACRLPFIWQ